MEDVIKKYKVEYSYVIYGFKTIFAENIDAAMDIVEGTHPNELNGEYLEGSFVVEDAEEIT